MQTTQPKWINTMVRDQKSDKHSSRDYPRSITFYYNSFFTKSACSWQSICEYLFMSSHCSDYVIFIHTIRWKIFVFLNSTHMILIFSCWIFFFRLFSSHINNSETQNENIYTPSGFFSSQIHVNYEGNLSKKMRFMNELEINIFGASVGKQSPLKFVNSNVHLKRHKNRHIDSLNLLKYRRADEIELR